MPNIMMTNSPMLESRITLDVDIQKKNRRGVAQSNQKGSGGEGWGGWP